MAELWMFQEPMRVRGVTRKFLCGRKILPQCPREKSQALSPIACVEVEVKLALVHRFIPKRLISENSYFAFLSTIILPVRAQMQLNQDSMDNQKI